MYVVSVGENNRKERSGLIATLPMMIDAPIIEYVYIVSVDDNNRGERSGLNSHAPDNDRCSSNGIRWRVNNKKGRTTEPVPRRYIVICIILSGVQ